MLQTLQGAASAHTRSAHHSAAAMHALRHVLHPGRLALRLRSASRSERGDRSHAALAATPAPGSAAPPRSPAPPASRSPPRRAGRGTGPRGGCWWRAPSDATPPSARVEHGRDTGWAARVRAALWLLARTRTRLARELCAVLQDLHAQSECALREQTPLQHRAARLPCTLRRGTARSPERVRARARRERAGWSRCCLVASPEPAAARSTQTSGRHAPRTAWAPSRDSGTAWRVSACRDRRAVLGV